MSHVAHDLQAEFPEHAERIHDLKMSDRHFANLVDEYYDVNRAIHRMETRVEPASEERDTEARRRRLQLKDEILQALRPE
jgi:uncharacterized protein YdcH (DUF465 family)